MREESRVVHVRVRALIAITACACACAISGGSAAASWAGGCPNEPIRLDEAYGPRLPDCRAYEQVSPVQKNLADARGAENIVQASPLGEHVTFYSVVPFPGVPGSVSFPQYLSTRIDTGGKEEWSTIGLEPPSLVDSSSPVVGSTEDLARTVVFSNNEPPLAPGGAVKGGNYYIRDNATNAYQLLAPLSEQALYLADAVPGGARILFETSAKLTEGAEEGKPNLYEWDEKTLNLIAADAVAGPSQITEGGSAGGAAGGYYTQNTISRDGSRIFFTDLASGEIYVYSHQASKAIKVSPGVAGWRAATPDGKFVFYTEGEVLYRLDVEAAEAGKPTPQPIADDVLGVAGVSDSGSYVYFATAGEKEEEAKLYVWHETPEAREPPPIFIANVNNFYDQADWSARCACNHVEPGEGQKTSRVSASGETLLLTSAESLTGYDNKNGNLKYYELYIYDAAKKELACASCNPTGAPATSSAFLRKKPPSFAAATGQVFLSRNLSEDGNRVFFQTEESLLPADVNHQMDVYEWEREGIGSCSEGSGDGSGGCLYLISPGTSNAETYFGNADAEGNNVFFFTRQSLVGQDQDYNADLYDASVNGGMESQNLPLTASCTSEEVCRGAPPLAPGLVTPSSATFSGTGNLLPQPEPKAKPKLKANKKRKAKIKKKAHKAKKPGSNHGRRKSG